MSLFSPCGFPQQLLLQLPQSHVDFFEKTLLIAKPKATQSNTKTTTVDIVPFIFYSFTDLACTPFTSLYLLGLNKRYKYIAKITIAIAVIKLAGSCITKTLPN